MWIGDITLLLENIVQKWASEILSIVFLLKHEYNTTKNVFFGEDKTFRFTCIAFPQLL